MLANLSTLESLQKTHGHPAPVAAMSVFNADRPLIDFEHSDTDTDTFDFPAALEVIAQFSNAVKNNDEKEIAFWGPQFDKLQMVLSKASDSTRPVCEVWKKVLLLMTKEIPSPPNAITKTGGMDGPVDPETGTEAVQEEQGLEKQHFSSNTLTKEFSAKLSGTPEELSEFLNLYGKQIGIVVPTPIPNHS